MDLIWIEGDVIDDGPDTRPSEVDGIAGRRCVGVRFPPGGLPAVPGVPAVDLCNTRLPLRDVIDDGHVDGLVEGVAGSPDPGRVLEAFASPRLTPVRDPRADVVARLLAEGATVAEVADQANPGERQLRRRSPRWFGSGPETLARILRFRSALRLGRQGQPAAVVAARAGCVDQPRLVRETRALAGVGFAGVLS